MPNKPAPNRQSQTPNRRPARPQQRTQPRAQARPRTFPWFFGSWILTDLEPLSRTATGARSNRRRASLSREVHSAARNGHAIVPWSSHWKALRWASQL